MSYEEIIVSILSSKFTRPARLKVSIPMNDSILQINLTQLFFLPMNVSSVNKRIKSLWRKNSLILQNCWTVDYLSKKLWKSWDWKKFHLLESTTRITWNWFGRKSKCPKCTSKFCDVDKFEELELDTYSFYLPLAHEILYECIRPAEK